MNRTPFSDADAAIYEAVFLADQDGKPYAVIDVDGETMHVVPLSVAESGQILEIVSP